MAEAQLEAIAGDRGELRLEVNRLEREDGLLQSRAEILMNLIEMVEIAPVEKAQLQIELLSADIKRGHVEAELNHLREMRIPFQRTELEARVEQARLELMVCEQQLENARVERDVMTSVAELRLDLHRERLAGLSEQIEKCVVAAEGSGTVFLQP